MGLHTKMHPNIGTANLASQSQHTSHGHNEPRNKMNTTNHTVYAHSSQRGSERMRTEFLHTPHRHLRLQTSTIPPHSTLPDHRAQLTWHLRERLTQKTVPGHTPDRWWGMGLPLCPHSSLPLPSPPLTGPYSRQAGTPVCSTALKQNHIK